MKGGWVGGGGHLCLPSGVTAVWICPCLPQARSHAYYLEGLPASLFRLSVEGPHSYWFFNSVMVNLHCLGDWM